MFPFYHKYFSSECVYKAVRICYSAAEEKIQMIK